MNLLCLHQLNWNFSELNPTLYHICILRLCPMVLHFVFIPTVVRVQQWSEEQWQQLVKKLYFTFCSPAGAYGGYYCIYTAAPVQRGAPAGAGHKTDSVLNLLQGYLTIQRFRDKKLSRHHFSKALHFFIEVGNSLKTNHDRKSRRPYLWRRSLLQSDIMAVSSGPIRIKDIIEGRPTSSRTDSSKRVFVTGSLLFDWTS